MGLLDRVGGAVKSAASTVANAAEGAATKAKETAQEAVQKVEHAVSDGVDHSPRPQSPDAAARPASNAPLEARANSVPEPVKKALTGDAASAHVQANLGGIQAGRAEGVSSPSTGGLAAGLGAFAQRIKQTGQEIRETATQLKGEVQQQADDLGKKAVALGQKIERAPQAIAEKAAELPGKIEELGRKAIDLGGLGKPLEAPPGAVDRLKQKGQELINTGKNVAAYVDARTNPEKQVDNLKPGDKFTFSSSGGGSINIPGTKAGVIKAGEKVTYEVESKVQTDSKTGQPVLDPKTGKPQVKYVVSFDAESTGGAGVSQTEKHGSFSADAQAGVGGKIEYSFNSPEEAKQGIAALNKQLSHAVVMDISQARKDPLTPAENALLNKNISSVEMRGVGAGQLAGELGADTGPRGAGKLTVRGEPTVKLTYQDGAPSRVSVKMQLSGEGQVALNAAAGDHGTNAKVTVGQAGAKATVSVERSYPIPKGLHADDVLRDPVGTLKPAIKEMRKGEQVTVTGQLDASAHAMGNGYAMKSEVSITGSPDKVLNPAVLADLHAGRQKDALIKAGNEVTVTGSTSTYQLSGLVLSPEINVDGVGSLGAEWTAVTSRQRSAQYYGGTGTQAAQDAARALQDADVRMAELQREAGGDLHG